ncbi:unnamed protein product [Linum trigynum]|uniref:RNase H type-1 domain-containing protein n=1 Tax=Linum trigynum TaxID=586398 RepID=A0AAV2DFX1_9ROSI
MATCGITVANSHGQVYDSNVERFFCSNSMQAEAYAILNGVTLTAREQRSACVKSDCQILVNALKLVPAQWPWQCRALLARVSTILVSALWVKVMFVPKRHNLLADWVAHNARLGALPRDWIIVADLLSPLL